MQNTKTSRQEIRVNEAGELNEVRTLINKFNANDIDVVPVWEPAYHDRVRRDTTDGQVQHLARGNHACDRLASYEVTLGRQRELDFYTAHQPLAGTKFYFSGSGLAIQGDPYEQIGQKCELVHASRVLTQGQHRDPTLVLSSPTCLTTSAMSASKQLLCAAVTTDRCP